MRDWHPDDPRIERRLRLEAWCLVALQLLGATLMIKGWLS